MLLGLHRDGGKQLWSQQNLLLLIKKICSSETAKHWNGVATCNAETSIAISNEQKCNKNCSAVLRDTAHVAIYLQWFCIHLPLSFVISAWVFTVERLYYFCILSESLLFKMLFHFTGNLKIELGTERILKSNLFFFKKSITEPEFLFDLMLTPCKIFFLC